MPTRRLPVTIALCIWTLLVWTTRIANIWNDDALSDAAKLRSTGLALSFTVLAAVAGHAVFHRTAWRDLAVKALAGWTIGVWITRSVGIATADHDTSFVVVHLVLAGVSIALSILAVRESARLSPVPAEARR